MWKARGSIWLSLDMAIRNLTLLYGQTMNPFGLTAIELHILRVLFNQDRQKASDLARAVGREATSFTPNLDSLVKKGYVVRQKHKHDRRCVLICLTELTKTKRDAIVEIADKLDCFIESQLDPDQLAVLIGTLLQFQRIDPATATLKESI